MSSEEFRPEKALLIILGASEYPQHELYKDHPMESAQPSVNDIRGYFVQKQNLPEGRGWSLPEINLFNSLNDVGQQLQEIELFLKKNDPTDLFIYYVGHGVTEDNNLYLHVHNSTDLHSAISLKRLFEVVIVKKARDKRCYIILDTCYSGMVRKVAPETERGIVCFCSGGESTCNFRSEGMSSSQPTLFTGALLDVLKKGESSDQKVLSCNKVNSLLDSYLKDKNEGKLAPQYYVIGKQQNVIGNLGIFPNPVNRQVGTVTESLPYSMEDIEGLPQIKWHITTSNKGGVGKTLLSMMLLTQFSSEIVPGNENLEITNCPLVIDLNGVNTDLKRLLVVENLLEKDISGKLKYVALRNEKVLIVKVNQEKHPFFLGWMNDDPYKMLNASSFFNLLMAIKGEGINEIKRVFGNTFSISTVIVDTNYHFCNIFSDTEEDYKHLKDFLWDKDLFFIWFVWVYGQIRNLARKEIKGTPAVSVSDISRMRKVSACVEKYITSSNTAQFKESPFFHVINPMGLAEKKVEKEEVEEEKQSLISSFFSRLRKKSGNENERKEDVQKINELLLGQAIPELAAIASLDICAKIRFTEMQSRMLSALPKPQETANPTLRREKFENMIERKKLKNMLEGLKKTLLENQGQGRPRNLIPVSTYQEILESYQNFEHIYLEDLEQFGVYIEFKKVLGKI